MEDGDRSPGCGARKEGCNARQEDWSFQKGLEAATTKNVTVLLALFHKLSCCKVASVGASSMCFRLELLLHFFVTAACKSQKVNPSRSNSLVAQKGRNAAATSMHRAKSGIVIAVTTVQEPICNCSPRILRIPRKMSCRQQ